MFRRLFPTRKPASGSTAASLDLAAAVLDIDTDSCASSIDEPRTLSNSAWTKPSGNFNSAILSTTSLPAAPTPPISRRGNGMMVRYGNDDDDNSALFSHIDTMFDCTEVSSHRIDDPDFALDPNLVHVSNVNDDGYNDNIFHSKNHSLVPKPASPNELPAHDNHSTDRVPTHTMKKSPFSSPMSSASLSASTPMCTPLRKKRLRRRQACDKDSANRRLAQTFLSPEEEDLPTPRYARRSTRAKQDPELRPRRTLVGLICRRLSPEVIRKRTVERSVLNDPALYSSQIPIATVRKESKRHGVELDGPVSYAKDEWIDFLTGDSRHDRSSWFSRKNSRTCPRDNVATRLITGV